MYEIFSRKRKSTFTLCYFSLHVCPNAYSAINDVPIDFQNSINHSTIVQEGDPNVKCMTKSHSLKRYSSNLLCKFEELQRLAGRCGWDDIVKWAHSVFDYANIHSEDMDQRCAQIMSGWLIESCGERIGGIPPDLSAIRTSPEVFTLFVHNLFGQ